MGEAASRVIPSTCWECSAYCGSLLTVGGDGRVTKVAPNPASPVSRGAFCVKGIRALPEATYQEGRLLHPLRRLGERGSGRWERVSWDSALDEMAARLDATRRRHGPLSLTGAVSGAAFSRGPVMALLLRSLGSPNWMINQDLCGGCRAVSDRVTGTAMTGGEDVANAACLLVVGRNPAAADPPQWIEIRRAKERGARLVVIDPFRTQAAEIADLWLRPEPGTDAAIALAMIRHLVETGAWDRGFVERHCHGFDALAARAARYTPGHAAALTGVPADDIERAAAMYADGPACFLSGHGIDAASNGVQTFRAFHALVAISGNLDRRGGNRRSKRPPGFRTWMDLLHDPRFRLPEAVANRAIGADRYPLWAGPLGWQTACHNSSVLEAMLTGEPYPVRALYASGVNIAVMYPDTRRTLAALRSLDFLAVAAHTMTPTAAQADLVLPKTTGLEEEEVALNQKVPCVTYTAAAGPPQGEARSDLDIAVALLDRMRALGAVAHEFLPWRSRDEFNRDLLGDSGIALEDLRRDGFAEFPYALGDFDRQVFATPTGRVELHSTLMERFGLDPLPDYVPPLDRRAVRPDGFPLRLQTGMREKTYHHSRFREQAWARKVSPDPKVHVHPETAAAHGVRDGDWVSIETAGGRGAVRLRAAVTDRTLPGTLTTGVGWWLPERPAPEFGALEVNVNAALSYTGPADPATGSVDTGSIPCRMRPG
ncbi:molybdopterin-dependent oxidoreductase [Roseomonas sp. NAR14]|uniref:Molybdopterin-dependent oxidoreductase n=1 Tax=Roseomonas acroporae TaxID=2937791 RepID=A0A9X1YD00_9PROT|nr:molybdopterin-dependent oxidoreductase [Roseomonas acroporae]MCK8786848.1 molybdopterin-dependent oxidoreductase [Roseomonas acroporae]